ncbi:MAG: LysR family transcriptional regulator [Clostridiales bacterium]|nr:LysR family transcriptional regulator [Clostridiales bacterium]
MDFKQYQYVLKIAEMQNLTKAANALYITQPSLSHYIARIEEEMGTQIFNRNTTPISLTLAGEKYVETAKMILSLNDRLRQEVADIAQNKKGLIRVGMSHARASFFLPYILPAFKESYPGVDVQTVEVRADLVEEYVAKGRCDLGILPLPISKKYSLEQEVVCREELLLVSGQPLPEGRKGNRRPYVKLDEMGDYPYSLLKRGHGIRTAVDVLFMEHGIHPKQIFETTSNETAYRLSTVNMGLAIVPETTVILSHAVNTPCLYGLSPEGIWWEIGVIYQKKEMLSDAQKRFICLMQEKFANYTKYYRSKDYLSEERSGVL